MESYEYYLETYGLGYWPIYDDIAITIDEEMVIFSKWNDQSYLHRLDGPAAVFSSNVTYFCDPNAWYINNYNVTKEINQWARENDIDLDNLSDVDKALIKLTWSSYGI